MVAHVQISRAFVRTCMYVHIRTASPSYFHACVYIYVHAYMRRRTCIHVYAYACIYLLVYECMYVYIVVGTCVNQQRYMYPCRKR
jgi:hypothetical protein